MPRWWHRFMHMPDAERAKILARISMGLILVLLYGLGAFSIYLRDRYLQPTLTPTREATEFLAGATGAPTVIPSATPTLYPTITPMRVDTGAEGAVEGEGPASAGVPSTTDLQTATATLGATATPEAGGPTATATVPNEPTLAPPTPYPTPTKELGGPTATAWPTPEDVTLIPREASPVPRRPNR